MTHSTPSTPTYYKASRMLNHHTHPTDPIRDQKTHAFDTSMANPSRQHNFAMRVSHRSIFTDAEFGRSHRVWVLLPKTVMKSMMVSKLRTGRNPPWITNPKIDQFWNLFFIRAGSSCSGFLVWKQTTRLPFNAAFRVSFSMERAVLGPTAKYANLHAFEWAGVDSVSSGRIQFLLTESGEGDY